MITSTYGGTGNGFTKFTGPTTSEKTFTLPNANATILTSNAAVTVAQGGTGATTKAGGFDALSPMSTSGDIIYGGANGTGTRLAKGTDGQILKLASGVPTWASSGVPYTGATRAVDLGSYDLTVNGILVGRGLGETTADNIAIGTNSLDNNFGLYGNMLTAIGNYADVDGNGDYTDATAIGYQATISESYSVVLGDNNIQNVYTSGTVHAAGTALTSDVRLKRNIKPLTNSIEQILKLNPVSYEKKINLSSNDYSIKENGFIAQEIQKVLPDLVKEGKDKDKLLSVNYTALIPVLTKSIQEQQQQIASQQKESLEQKKQIADQNKKIDRLEALVEQLLKKNK